MKIVEERLRELRLDARYSQQQLADKCETTQATIGRYEIDMADPPLEKLLWFVEFFDVSLDFICIADFTLAIARISSYTIIEVPDVADDKLAYLLIDFAVDILRLTDQIKGHYSLSNQLKRSVASIGANICDIDTTKELRHSCGTLRRMLIASSRTAKGE